MTSTVSMWHNADGAEVFSVRDEDRDVAANDGLVAWVAWRRDAFGDEFLWCRRCHSAMCVDIKSVWTFLGTLGLGQ